MIPHTNIFPIEAPSNPKTNNLFVDELCNLKVKPGVRAIECEDFPFEALSDVAERESWRKEVNRPLYHIHKWWGQRLGTVFRAIVLGALCPKGSDVSSLFYRSVRIPEAIVFDPFMGSGTTLGEALKLGTRAIGRDINPVSNFLVRNALSLHKRSEVMGAFHQIERKVADRIRHFYSIVTDDGIKANVLYYFWVKQVDCPSCSSSVDLFTSRIFAKHAYPKRYPRAQSVCPGCGMVNEVRYDASEVKCLRCEEVYDPQACSAKGQKAYCLSCNHSFYIAQTVRKQDSPPKNRLYAKLVLLPDGKKAYLPTNQEDEALYKEASELLKQKNNPYPIVPIEPGYNTNQVLGYNYRYWHHMFNDRQLLCLSILADEIRTIKDRVLRELFTCLFSGTLEFNNMFASYKGEGTGAVRHMFAHHILKPARMPLEANPWGTPKSSGAFSTLFKSRLLRALDYAENPFELRVVKKNGRVQSEKIFDLSDPVGYGILESFQEFSKGERVYLSCGDSSNTDIAEGSVDAVITDPPFFDNVHYSQLADFFHVWQRHILGNKGYHAQSSTRCDLEVQNNEVKVFTDRLCGVLKEAHRVLKNDGILVFTYHHSRSEGWQSVLEAILNAEFAITAVQPIKSEMSVAMPKRQTKEPIDLDMIIVCRKKQTVAPHIWNGDLWRSVIPSVQHQVKRLIASDRRMSKNDIRIILMAQLLKRLSLSPKIENALSVLNGISGEVDEKIECIFGNIKYEDR